MTTTVASQDQVMRGIAETVNEVVGSSSHVEDIIGGVASGAIAG